MNYKVAVVDDEPKIIDRISELLKQYAESGKEELHFEIDTYSCGDDLLKSNTKCYEILFLDINMPGRNGLSVAKKIRDSNKTAVIIFCTNYAQYAINGYEVNALGYLVKPLEKVSFDRNLDRALNVLKNSQFRAVRIKTLHGIEVVKAADIVYAEIQIHNLYYNVLKDGNIVTYRTRGSMQEIENSLSDLGFARCSACYLVNLRRVLSIINGEISLVGGIKLPVSRKYLRSFTDSFMKYLGSNGTINV